MMVSCKTQIEYNRRFLLERIYLRLLPSSSKRYCTFSHWVEFWLGGGSSGTKALKTMTQQSIRSKDNALRNICTSRLSLPQVYNMLNLSVCRGSDGLSNRCSFSTSPLYRKTKKHYLLCILNHSTTVKYVKLPMSLLFLKHGKRAREIDTDR